MKKVRYAMCSVCLVFAAFGFAACGSSANNEVATSDAATDNTVPGDVVMTSPTATIPASPSISKSKSLKADPPPDDGFVPKGDKPGDAQGEDFQSKKEALQTLISGSGECGFTLAMPTVAPPDCYGPEVDYQNHPDGVPMGQPQLPVGDTGIWSAMEGTQACAAAKMNELVGKVASKVDNMINIFGVMACAGKKASTELPVVGASVDMKDVMAGNMSVPGLTVNSATLKRLADDSAGNSVFLSTIGLSMSFPGIADAQTSGVILKHVPTAADNSTYKGKLSMKMTKPADSMGGNCQGFTPTPTQQLIAVVIAYEKTSATSLKYKVDYAEFCDPAADPFDANNNIDPTKSFNWPSVPDGWGGNYNYGIFSLNPQDGSGSVAYAWQAGHQDQRTRVLNITTSIASGVGSGTAYYGFGPDVVDNADLGLIDGFICNWAGPAGATEVQDRSAANLLAQGKGKALAQKQVLERAASATVFTPSSSSIKYAITNSCNAAAGGNFTYQNSTGTAMDNDRISTQSAIANDLIPLTDISFTQPTPPADVGGST